MKIALAMMLLLAMTASGIHPGQAQTTATLGLSVSPDGLVLKEGRPYQGIGVNYFSAFERMLANSADTSYRQGFQQLAAYKIPYVRFMACGFWPVEFRLYQQNKEYYFRLLDGVVHAAEQNHVGLIPSLFWAYFAIPDLVGEPMDQWGNPQSKTRQFMRQYVQEVVTRYRNSPAIWGWEFGNELMLMADLPNALDPGILPPTITSLGCPATRGPHDALTAQIIADAFSDFAATVRLYDPTRPIFTGNAIPRPCAWHNSAYRSWDADTRAQFAQILLRDNPDPVNAVTVHIYYDCDNTYYADGKVSLDGLMRDCKAIAATAKKPLFIGEFGAPASLGPQVEHDKMVQLIAAIENNNIPLSAAWNFNRPGDTEWDIELNNERGYILELIAKANTRIWQKLGIMDLSVPVELSTFYLN